MIGLTIYSDQIIYPTRYDGNPNSGYDIALIGLSEENNKIIKRYLKINEKKSK